MFKISCECTLLRYPINTLHQSTISTQLLEEQDEAEGKRKSLTDSEIVQEPEVGDEIDQAKAEEQKRLQQQQEKEEKERQEKEQQEREQQDKEQQEKERIAREQQQQRDQEQRAAAKALEEEQRRRDLMVAESFALFKQVCPRTPSVTHPICHPTPPFTPPRWYQPVCSHMT